MPKDREQSAIDAIYVILDEIRNLDKKISVLDNNVKLLNNKVSKLSVTNPAISSGPTATGPTATAPTAKVPGSSSDHIVKIFGRIKNQRKKPIKGVYVKVYSPKGEVLKSRETDSDGYWEARLSPGSYSVELNASHLNSKFRPINKNIIIDETMSQYEVK